MTGKPDPDVDRYLEMERIKVAHLFTARLEGRMVGYCIMLVFPHPHYRTKLTAICDSIYLKPEHRGFSAFRFIRWTDEFCYHLGVTTISRAVNVRNDFSRLLEKFGYERFETSYLRRM